MAIEDQIAAYKSLRENGQAFFVATYEDADRIINALEKQIPIKPTEATETAAVIDDAEFGDVKKMVEFYCSVCGELVGIDGCHDNYCLGCGQKIGWSDRKETKAMSDKPTDKERLAVWLETATKIAMDKVSAEIHAIVKEKHHYNSRMYDTTIYSHVAEELLKAGVILPPEDNNK